MPSKKVLSVLIVCSAFVVSIILANNKVGSPKEIAQKVSVTGINAETNPIVNDNWKSDLENLPPTTSISEEASSSETLTDIFSRSVMANYFSMKQSGSLDSTSAQQLVEQGADFVADEPIDAYTTGNVVINADNSLAAVTKYGNDIGAAMKTNSPKQLDNEVNLFGDMMENKDNSRALQLQNIATVYKNMAFSLSKIIVPSSFAQNHLAFLNGINALSQNVNDMSYGLTDPVRSLRGLANYKTNVAEVIVATKNMKNLFSKDGVSYKQGDNGYFFYFGI